MLALADLFLMGLALDITGAALLAHALFASPEDIGRASGTFVGSNPYETVSRAQDKVDARFGLTVLATGFALQAVAYAIELLASPSSPRGVAPTALALGLGVVTAITAVTVWIRRRERQKLAQLVSVALAREGSGREFDEKRPGWTRHKAALLMSLGQAAGYPLIDEVHGEPPTAYARRVFGVELPEDEI